MHFSLEVISIRRCVSKRGGFSRRGEEEGKERERERENKSRSNSKAVRNYRGPSRRSQEGNDETVPINNRYYIVHYHTEKARRQEQTFSQLRGGEA